MKKKMLLSLAVCMLVITIPFMAIAHSGKTDGSGGHRDNKNKSGLGYYHYHCGGHPPHLHNGGVCPYKGGSSSKSVSVPKTVYANSITANNVPAQINAGDSATLEASVYPANAEDKNITWESSDESVLTVSETGELTAVGIGTATITAKTSRGTSKSFEITVNEVMAKNINIMNSKGDILLATKILIGDSMNLKCSFIPENTTYKDVEWKTDNENIVSVTTDGKITAKDVGKAVVTAIHKELTSSVKIEVKPIEADRVEIILPEDMEMKDEIKPIMEKGSTIQLNSLIEPENTTYKDIKWSVDDESVASVDETGKLTAKETGVVIVTATTKCGKTDEIEIEIYSNAGLVALGIGGTAAVIGAGTFLWLKKKKCQPISE